MNDGIKEVPYAPPAQFKRQRILNPTSRTITECVVLDTFDSEVVTASRGIFSATNYDDVTHVVLKVPITFKDSRNILNSQTSYGSFSLNIPDGTAVNGNARAKGAVDLQIARTLKGNVASGSYSFIAGYDNSGSGNTSVALGASNSAQGTSAVCIGQSNTSSGQYAVAIGASSQATSSDAVALGKYALSNSAGKIAFGTTGITTAGKVQSAIQNISAITKDTQVSQTINATPASGGVVLQNYSSAYFHIIAVGDAFPTASIAIEAKGLIRRGANASATTIVGTPTISTLFSDASLTTHALSLSADTTNGGLSITLTGDGIAYVTWTVNVNLVEVV